MTQATQHHPCDLFGHFADRYEALEALINEQSDIEQVRELLQALNEGFRAALDSLTEKGSD